MIITKIKPYYGNSVIQQIKIKRGASQNITISCIWNSVYGVSLTGEFPTIKKVPHIGYQKMFRIYLLKRFYFIDYERINPIASVITLPNGSKRLVLQNFVLKNKVIPIYMFEMRGDFNEKNSFKV